MASQFEEAKKHIQTCGEYELFCLHENDRCDVRVEGVIYEMTEEEYDSLENLPNVKNLRL